MRRLWHLRGITLWDLLRRVWDDVMRHDVFGQAAELAYFFLLALFPLLILLTNIFGYFAQSEALRSSLLDYFARVLPHSAFILVEKTLNQITSGASGGKLSLGILGTLWAASSGMAALNDGLSRAYEIKDRRPWWKARLVSIGLTFLFAAFTAFFLFLILAGEQFGAFIAGEAGLGSAFPWFWAIARWPLAFFFALTVVHLLYRFAPDIQEWHWRWMTPGALVAVGMWMLVSVGFRLYLRHYNSFNATYGSLGAVVILMLWFYIAAIAILTGAEIDSELEKAAELQDRGRLPLAS